MIAAKIGILSIYFPLLFLLALLNGAAVAGEPGEIGRLVNEYRILLDAGKLKGVEVTGAEELGRKSKTAFDSGDPAKAKDLLKEAIALLKGASGKASKLLPQEQPVLSSSQQRAELLKPSDSPFGIFGPYQFKLDSRDVMTAELINSYLLNVGAAWIQEMPAGIESVPGEIAIYSRLGREGGTRPPQVDYEKYKSALRQHVEKFKNRLTYWEVDTEPGGLKPPAGWKGYPKEYAMFLKETYKTVKSVCPNCQVVLGGMPGIGGKIREGDPNVAFLKDILDAGAAGYFDVFAFKQHHYMAGDYIFIKDKMNIYGKVLSSYGIDIKKIPVFVETATYDGNPNYPAGNPLSFIHFTPQTETQQAAALIKIYIFSLAQGVSKIFWNEIFERHDFGGSPTNPFNFYGLVNNPLNDGRSHKKLAYYTYKKMVEVLEGSNWKETKIYQEADGVYIYRFIRKNRPVWAAWNDNHEIKKISIAGIDSRQVKIIHPVPSVGSGKDVQNYATAFTEETVIVDNGLINIDLADMPVFIEAIE